MLPDNNPLDPTVTVESKKQTITIANGTSSTVYGKPTITLEKEKAILDEIESHCRKWSRIANAYIFCIVFFGVAAVTTSVLVSIYTGNEDMMSVAKVKIMACVSTISLGILTAFNLVTNAGNAKNAWRSLNAALMMYAAGSISIQQLIEYYQKGENQLGTFSFNYGANGEKPATYTQDIKASEEERKQKMAGVEIKEKSDTKSEVTVRSSDADKLINEAIAIDKEEAERPIGK